EILLRLVEHRLDGVTDNVHSAVGRHEDGEARHPYHPRAGAKSSAPMLRSACHAAGRIPSTRRAMPLRSARIDRIAAPAAVFVIANSYKHWRPRPQISHKAALLHRGADERGEERMRVVRAALQLGMVLHA